MIKPRPRGLRSIGLVPFLLVTSCAQVRTDHLVLDSNYCRDKGSPVTILWEKPGTPHTRIAKVEATKVWFEAATWNDVMLVLCREAYRLGAEAIIAATSTASYDVQMGPIGTGGNTDKLTAIAIRFDTD